MTLGQLSEDERKLSEIERKLREQLRVVQHASWAHRLRFTVIPLTLGIATGLAGVVLITFYGASSGRSLNAGTVLIYFCVPLTLLSAPANDARAAVGFCVLYVLVLALNFLRHLTVTRSIHAALTATPVCGMRYQLEVRMHTYSFVGVVYVLATAVLLSRLAQHAASRSAWLGWLRPITTRQLLLSLWLTTGSLYLVSWCVVLAYICAYGAIIPAFYTTSIFAEVLGLHIVLSGAVVIFCLSARLRLRVHAWLSAIGDGVSAAAGVAALMGNVSPQKAIVDGRRRLRAISCALLEPGVFESAAPSIYWQSKSVPAELDSIDAFVSHSWHDDPMDTWTSLQEWRADFVALKGREPRVWLDRCCILEPTADLLSLPIFLAGCQQLLILAGPTYLHRLWCVVELFVFEQMQSASSMDRASAGTLNSLITLRTLPGCNLAEFEYFDVGSAACFYPADKERLLTCIETACGSTGEFNTRARLLLRRLREQHAAAQLVPAAAPVKIAGVSIRVLPLAHAEAPDKAAAPRATARHCGHWTGGRWCLLGVAAAAVVVYGVVFAAYQKNLMVPILADCADCAAELRALSLDSHGYAGEARSGRAYRYSGTRAHVTRALTASAAVEVCASENGMLAVPRSTAEARRLSCIVGSDAFGAWIGVDPSEVEDSFIVGSVVHGGAPYRPDSIICVVMNPWGWMRSACGIKNPYICERG